MQEQQDDERPGQYDSNVFHSSIVAHSNDVSTFS